MAGNVTLHIVSHSYNKMTYYNESLLISLYYRLSLCLGRRMFEVFAATPETMSPAEIGEHAKRAEAMGFNGLQVPDAVHDGLLLAALALNATSTLVVSTSVLVAFPRSPMTVAVASWDLQQLSKGRFEIGLGASERQYPAL